MKTQKQYAFFYRNGLTIVFLALFLLSLVGQALTGWKMHNSDLVEQGGADVTLPTYLRSGHFISATFENFESEFLQMALYVVLTISLRQKGSSESKKLDGKEEVDRAPRSGDNAPWAVKRGGWILKIYSHSLSICFAILFLISWALHLYGSWQNNNVEAALKNMPAESVLSYFTGAEFWFESLQNWQSEFLSVASIVFLSIYLRQKGSPESKPVDAPDAETGS